MIFLVIMLFAVIAFLQIPGLIRQKLWPELIGFGILLLVGFGLSVSLVLGCDLPFISDAIGQGIRYLFSLK